MKMDKFIVSGTPHVRSKDSIQGIMRDVLIGLMYLVLTLW